MKNTFKICLITLMLINGISIVANSEPNLKKPIALKILI